METKRILVACGTGGVTSRNVAMTLEKYLTGKGGRVVIDTCKVVEVVSKVNTLHPDLVASPTGLPEVPVPAISATALLTGVGADKVYQEIYDILTK